MTIRYSVFKPPLLTQTSDRHGARHQLISLSLQHHSWWMVRRFPLLQFRSRQPIRITSHILYVHIMRYLSSVTLNNIGYPSYPPSFIAVLVPFQSYDISALVNPASTCILSHHSSLSISLFEDSHTVLIEIINHFIPTMPEHKILIFTVQPTSKKCLEILDLILFWLQSKFGENVLRLWSSLNKNK